MLPEQNRFCEASETGTLPWHTGILYNTKYYGSLRLQLNLGNYLKQIVSSFSKLMNRL
jgi:hypothetical protein